MEIDPNVGMRELPDEYYGDSSNDALRASRGIMQDIVGALPGKEGFSIARRRRNFCLP